MVIGENNLVFKTICDEIAVGNIDIYDYVECVHTALENLGYKQTTMEELKTNNLVFKTICDEIEVGMVYENDIKKPNLSEVTKNFYTLKEGEE